MAEVTESAAGNRNAMTDDEVLGMVDANRTPAAALVSTIIPVFNRAAQLREAVHSVLAQSYRPLEIIIVDNASTDDTARTVTALAHAHPREVRIAQCSTRGAGAAREVGRCLARGEFIQYLDSDDVLLPGKFSAQVRELRAAPQCAIAYGITRFRSRDGQLVQGPWKGTGEQVDQLFPSMLLNRWWDTSTPLYRRAIVERAGAWLNLLNEEDWEYDCRLAAMQVRLSYVPELVSETRDHAGERLNRGGSHDAAKLADRAQAHTLILQHALNAGITCNTPQMQHFSRALFLLARQCGAAGLSKDSQQLFNLSRDNAQPQRRKALDYRLYALAACLLGWRAAGKLACWRDQLRH